MRDVFDTIVEFISAFSVTVLRILFVCGIAVILGLLIFALFFSAKAV